MNFQHRQRGVQVFVLLISVLISIQTFIGHATCRTFVDRNMNIYSNHYLSKNNYHVLAKRTFWMYIFEMLA